MFDPRLRHALAALPEPVIIGHHSRVDPQVKTIDAQAPATFVTLCSMRIHVLPTPEIAAERAAEWLRTEIGRASAQRGRCLVALSGGLPPRPKPPQPARPPPLSHHHPVCPTHA